MYHLFFLDYFMLPDMVVSGNVTCAALQQAAASGEVDHDLWGRELTYISGKMPDKLLFQGAPEAAVYPMRSRPQRWLDVHIRSRPQGWLTRDSKKPLIFRKKM